MLNELFDDVTGEVEAVAKERNFDLVVKDQSLEKNVTNPGEAILQIGQRVVLYSKPEYDLTALVLKRLNERYEADLKKETRAPEAKPPAPPAKEK
jgi:Skp family chaperone for outer membrane proteins